MCMHAYNALGGEGGGGQGGGAVLTQQSHLGGLELGQHNLQQVRGVGLERVAAAGDGADRAQPYAELTPPAVDGGAGRARQHLRPKMLVIEAPCLVHGEHGASLRQPFEASRPYPLRRHLPAGALPQRVVLGVVHETEPQQPSDRPVSTCGVRLSVGGGAGRFASVMSAERGDRAPAPVEPAGGARQPAERARCEVAQHLGEELDR
jgi:hypothetical protein